MNLYYIIHQLENLSDDEAYDISLFVRSETPEEAIEQWWEHYDQDFHDDQENDGEIVKPLPNAFYCIPPDKVGVIMWWDDMKPITDTRLHAQRAAEEALGLADATA